MRKSLLFLLALLAFVLAYSLVILPLGDWHKEIMEEVQVKSKTLGKYKAFLDTAADTEEEIERIEKELKKFNAMLIDVKNDALGFARLNSYVQDEVRKSGLQVISIKPLNVLKYKLYVGMPLQINATADIKQMLGFLRRLSSAKYLITLDNMDVRVMNIRKPDKLRIKIQVSGYRAI